MNPPPAAAPPAHRIALHGAWTIWRWIWVRTSGFPSRGVLALAAPDVAAAADHLLQPDPAAAELRGRAIEQLWQLHRAGGPHARVARQAIEQLTLGKWPRDAGVLEPECDALGALRTCEEARAHQLARLEQAYAAGARDTAAALRTVASDAWFREALVWQNRNALRAGDWLRAHPEAVNTRARQNQHLIASYLQRYSVKNDTIGFFGPIGWGELRRDAGVEARPGPTLLKARQAYFERWAIDAVASTLAAAEDIRPFLAPRLLPTVAVTGTTLRYGFDRTAQVPTLIARVLGACDGETMAIAIARALVADPTLELGAEAEAEAEVYQLLEELAERKLITWTLELGEVIQPERELRGLLERIEAPDVRARALATLARLEAVLARVSAAAGDADRLEHALEELDATFLAITGEAASRRAGETYAARTPAYEDCERDLALTIGAPVLDRLGPVLALIAQCARWFTHEIATRYRAAVHARYRELARATSEPIRYAQFIQELEHLLPAQHRSPIAIAAEDEHDRRWASVLALDMAQHRVELTVAELAGRVADAFAAPAPGWPAARHVSPDVMIAARSVEDVARGAFALVLGEVHIGNSQMARFIRAHGPDDDDSLIRAYAADLPGPRVLPVAPKHQLHRALNNPWSTHDLDLEMGPSRSWRARDHVLRAGDLVIEEIGEVLAVRDVRTGQVFDIIVVLEQYLKVLVSNHFKPGPRGPHVPRVTIDGMVLCREQWRFATAELPAFSAEERGPTQFVAARAWARQVGLPRWVFAKIPEEPKPVFVDFDSPLYVEMLAKLVRKASSLTVSEMLPTLEDTWIPDAEGRTYTGELRMVVVDPVPWVSALPDGGAPA